MKSTKTYIFAKFHHFLTVLVLVLLNYACAPRKINQMKNGQRQGLWIVYKDNTKTKMLTRGRYKNGDAIGKWYFYTIDGALERTDRYKGSEMKVRFYHSNGKVAAKGRARIVNENDKFHYYWYGNWNYYLEDGRLEKIVTFEKGTAVKEEYKIAGRKPKYEELSMQLKQIEKDFDNSNHKVNEASKKYGNRSEEYNVAYRQKTISDSIILIRIDTIIKKYGFPGKQYVGDASGVIFYIIGFANWKVKEKYLDVFRRAAALNEIAQRDLAYFEDKYYLAKEGFQLYGTQSTYENKQFIYYPVTDLQNLNARRQMRELEEVDLKLYKEKN